MAGLCLLSSPAINDISFYIPQILPSLVWLLLLLRVPSISLLLTDYSCPVWIWSSLNSLALLKALGLPKGWPSHVPQPVTFDAEVWGQTPRAGRPPKKIGEKKKDVRVQCRPDKTASQPASQSVSQQLCRLLGPSRGPSQEKQVFFCRLAVPRW